MTKELIGAAIMIGILGIGALIKVFCQACGECARDSAEFPDQHEGEEAKQSWPPPETLRGLEGYHLPDREQQ